MKARENPFRVERVHSLPYRLDGATWEDLLARLKTLGWRGAVVGRHGSGKTTLIEGLAGRLEARGFAVTRLRLSEERRSIDWEGLRRLEHRSIVLLDGAEQLGPIAWLRFSWVARRAAGLVITSHRPGRLPTLWRCEGSPALVDALLDGLGESRWRGEAQRLFTEHRGSVREVLRGLYDIAGRERGPIEDHALIRGRDWEQGSELPPHAPIPRHHPGT